MRFECRHGSASLCVGGQSIIRDELSFIVVPEELDLFWTLIIKSDVHCNIAFF
jgi:hypothetical protein